MNYSPKSSNSYFETLRHCFLIEREPMEQSPLSIISLFLAVQGITLTLALWQRRSETSYPYRGFSILMILVSLMILTAPNVLLIPSPFDEQILSLCSMSFGPVLTMAITSLGSRSIKLTKWIGISLLPTVLLILFFIADYLFIPLSLASSVDFVYDWNWVIGSLLEGIAIVMSLRWVWNFRKTALAQSAGDERPLLTGIGRFLILYAVLFCIDLVNEIHGWQSGLFEKKYSVNYLLIFTIWMSGILYLFIVFQETLRGIRTIVPEIPSDRNKQIYDDDFIRALANRARETLCTNDYFTEQSLTLPLLAEKCACTVHELSRAINEGTGGNFASFVNAMRINKACVLLKEKRNMSVLQVALESGFSSKTTFNRLFRESTGVTPSEYRQ